MKIHANDKYIIIESDGIEVKLVKMINGELYDTGHMRIIGDISVKSIQDIISYIHSNYTVSSLDLIDECVKDGIPMSMLRYFTTENSWYQDNFGKSDISNVFYDTEKRVLYNKKTNTSWEKFMNLTWAHMISIPLDETKELYIKAKTWQEFFVPLIERVEFNEAFSDFFNKFLHIYVGLHNLAFSYSIPVRDYP